MTEPEVRWGKYLTWEGPYVHGTTKYVVPENPTEEEKIMAVLTATEGGSFDAINMYDKCIATAGLIQWCDAGQFSVADLLGKVLERAPEAFEPISTLMDERGLSFKKNARNRSRFFFSDWRGEVDRLEEQRQLWLLDSSGKIGSWDEASKAWAIGWASALSKVLSHPKAVSAQVEYTVPRLYGFVMKEALPVVFGEWPKGTEALAKATQAAYLSFAGNLPATASKMALAFASKTTETKGTMDWTVGLLRELTFGPNITIYPGRYERIRPVVERLYGIDLPNFAADLRRMDIHNSSSISDYPEAALDTVEEIQEALIQLGYDLGPRGADGRMGEKTTQAVISFQQIAKLKADGVVGPKTKTALYALTHR